MIGLDNTTGTGIDSTIEHVRQSIRDIITTPVGSRVMRRSYGSIIPDLIDQPLNQATVLRLYAATAAAIMAWEPRMKLSSISLSYSDPAGAVIDVSGTVNEQSISTTTRIGGGL